MKLTDLVTAEDLARVMEGRSEHGTLPHSPAGVPQVERLNPFFELMKQISAMYEGTDVSFDLPTAMTMIHCIDTAIQDVTEGVKN